MKHQWQAGDWVVFDLSIGQIKKFEDDGCAVFSDGFCETSGHRLADRFRPLTLDNKRITETFDIYYRRLKDINGEGGFNYPAISSHFSALALAAMDSTDNRSFYDLAQQFVKDARDYKSIIQGIPLFRPKLRAAHS